MTLADSKLHPVAFTSIKSERSRFAELKLQSIRVALSKLISVPSMEINVVFDISLTAKIHCSKLACEKFEF